MKKKAALSASAALVFFAAAAVLVRAAWLQPIEARAMRLEYGEVVSKLETSGVIERTESHVAVALVAGQLESIAVAPGERVEKNQLITRVSAPARRSAYRQTTAAADALDRLMRSPGFEAGEDALRLTRLWAGAEANMALEELNLECVRSPMGGTVAELMAGEGDWVAQGAPLAVIEGDGERVVIPLRDVNVSRVAPGQPVRCTRDGKLIAIGVVSRVASLMEPQLGAVAAAYVDIPSTGLMPGISLDCEFRLEERQGLVVPLSAMRGEAVMTAENGRAVLKPVSISHVDASGVEITGVSEGTWVLVDGAVAPGARVRPVPMEVR